MSFNRKLYMRSWSIKNCEIIYEQRRKRVAKCPEISIINGVKNRCNNPKHNAFKNYGGRGIRCFLNSYSDIISLIGHRPSKKHTIDRIDVNGHYEKGNIRWATWKQQANNKRKKHAFL